MPKNLDEYRAKRSAGATPEPFGRLDARQGATAPTGGELGTPRLFVVQKHDATRLHWDLRLELGGVLVSWAVPRGPSYDPAEKRFAMHVEDHPVEYADFEGVIPAKNYGAGPSICWDRGSWLALEDPEQGMTTGKLLFELRGYKLHGIWTLVRTSGRLKTRARGRDDDGGDQWLLIKHRDAYSGPGRDDFVQQSILSGLTVEELGAGVSRGPALHAELAAAGAIVPARPVDLAKVEVMLADTAARPFSRPGWLFELKYDGFRLLIEKSAAGVRLRYRSGNDATRAYPELVNAAAALPAASFILDGEVVVLGDDGRPSFNRLQKRMQIQRDADLERARVTMPATWYGFDFLALDDLDLRKLPLTTRKAALARLLPPVGPLRYSEHFEHDGEALFERVRGLGMEGIVGKRADGPYRNGRSKDWLKVKAEHTADVVMVGYALHGSRWGGTGSLHVAAWDGSALQYVGRVASGLDEAKLKQIHAMLDPLRVPAPPCLGAPTSGDHIWVKPQLIMEIRYLESTADGMLRFPVLLRFRDDKKIEECILPARHTGATDDPTLAPSQDPAPAPASASAPVPVPVPVPVPDPSLSPSPSPPPSPPPTAPRPSTLGRATLTNPKKIFWPDEGYTKSDLYDFYRAVSPYLLPYLRDRALVMTRYPDGITGKSFFQHDAPAYVPQWVRTMRMWNGDRQSESSYFICDDVDTLLYIANLGCIPLHVWGGRVNAAGPDWTIVDLDPKGAPFKDVVRIARAVHDLCDRIELHSYIKTSGATGLHVMIPIAALASYDEARLIAELIARVIVAELPDIATTARMINARGGKVYLDTGQNGHGRTVVSPLCVRPLPGAPVSTPLEWSEVNARLDPRKHTIKTVLRRLDKKGDPLAPILTDRPDLPRAISHLTELVRALG